MKFHAIQPPMNPPRQAQPPSFSAPEFRAALGMFATGVTIVTGRDANGHRIGLTANSFNSVSLDPPLVLFSIARNAKSFEAWQEARGFAVNVLAEEQVDISNRFARPLADKWGALAFASGAVCRFPLIPGALAAMECVHYANYDGGDHLILVGRVVSISRHPASRRPLVFHGGRYRILDDEERISTPREADVWLHGW